MIAFVLLTVAGGSVACSHAQGAARFVARVTVRAPLTYEACAAELQRLGWNVAATGDALCGPPGAATWYHAAVTNVGGSTGNPYCTMEGFDRSGRTVLNSFVALQLFGVPAGPFIDGGHSVTLDYWVAGSGVTRFISSCVARTGTQVPI
jgi:hypothetical protein